jgi:signal transduction histidine kinase
MTAGVWLAAYLILTGLFLTFPEMPHAGTLLFLRAIGFFFAAVMCGAIALALRPFADRTLLVQLPLALAASLAAAFVTGVAANWLFSGLETPSSPWILQVLSRAHGYVWVFLAWCCAYLALNYSARSRENELRLIEAQALTADAQNRMLRYQINPHFLFNTLNALQTLMSDRKVPQAKQMVLNLADFLRYSLVLSPDEKVTLGEEVEAQAAYLSIEQARFGKRLNIVFDVAARASRARVPSLILQPLIENAVKYAVAPSRDPVTITLSAVVEGERVRIEITDDGRAAPGRPPSLGLGLENVRRRLDLAYDGKADFSFGPGQTSGFRAVISAPLETDA